MVIRNCHKILKDLSRIEEDILKMENLVKSQELDIDINDILVSAYNSMNKENFKK